MSRSSHSTLASPATRATTALPPHPPTRSEGPDDPARISPLHLPALHHVAADLDGLNAPVKIVNSASLDRCDDCATGDDVPELGAIATVVATDTHGFRYRSVTCALHLAGVVRHYNGHGWALVVEVLASSRQWFERSDRETFYAVDESRGVAVTRGIWDAWQVVDVVDGFGSPRLLAAVGLRDGESFNACRGRAEVLAQAVAAQAAADAYEASFSDAVTVALPVTAIVSGVAA